MTSTRTIDGQEVPVAGKWVFDHDHTVLGFVARHMVFTKVRGRFNEFQGAIFIAERLEDSHVELEIDVLSLTTEVPDHARTSQVFGLPRGRGCHPQHHFSQHSSRPGGDSAHR